MKTPEGLQEIIELFGDPASYIGPDGNLSAAWQQDKLTQIALPFSMPLDWNRAVSVTHMTCHKLLTPTFAEVFEQAVERGLRDQFKTYGGCFAYRPQRGSTKLSTHTWGIALDLNPFENQMGTQGNMDPRVIELLSDLGFFWGGDFSHRKDPMHFQFCTGY